MQTGLQAGSTACVVLQVGSHLLVASLGDSKALLCPATTCSPPPPPPDATPSTWEFSPLRNSILKWHQPWYLSSSVWYRACHFHYYQFYVMHSFFYKS